MSESASGAEQPPTTVEGVGELAAHVPSSRPTTATELPPEAVALAGRFFDAARSGGSEGETLLQAGLERGLSANLTNDKGDTLLMLASYHGHAQMVRLLLSRGADPNRLNDRGQTPLAGVVFKNERECILALLEGGADPRLGQPNAIDSCKVFGQEEYENLFNQQVDKLKASGHGAMNGAS